MLYREAGDFKTSYEADSQTFPIRLDRLGYYLILAVAVLIVPFVIDSYWVNAERATISVFPWSRAKAAPARAARARGTG